jgi:hypothetical protein
MKQHAGFVPPAELLWAINKTSLDVMHVCEPKKTTYSTSFKNCE